MTDKAILDRLAGTLACDAHGRPLVLHHGTHAVFDRFEKTSDVGFHFGTIDQAEKRWNEKAKGNRNAEWRIVSVALAAKKVLVLHDDPRSWETWKTVRDLAHKIDPELLYRLRDEGITTPEKAVQRIRGVLLEQGYDAIVYRNMWESTTARLEWSWAALHADAVVNVGPAREKTLLLEEVGDPSLRLPTEIKQIPALQTKACALRNLSDKRAILARFGEIATAQGLPAPKAEYPHWGVHDTFYDISMMIDDVLCKGKLNSGGGSVTLMPEGASMEDTANVIDDWIYWNGLGRGARKGIRVDWSPGDPLDRFIETVERTVGKVVAVVKQREREMAPAI